MTTVLHQFWRSSASYRVRWALAFKGVAFSSVAIDLLANEQLSDAHRAKNPIGHVPALEIDGHTLAESVAILEYLEETIPTPALYPKSPLARARVRQIVELVNSGVQPLQNPSVYNFHSQDKDETKRWIQHFNVRGLTALERVLEQLTKNGERTSSFAVGDAFTAADIFVTPQVGAARRFGVDLAPFPLSVGVETASLALPHAKSALPENQPGAPA